MTFIQIAGSGSTPNQYVSSFNTVLLPVQNYVLMSIASASVATSNWGSGNSLVCPVIGFYTCTFLLNTPSVAANRQVQIRLLRNGGEVANPGVIEVGDFGNPGMWGLAYNTTFNPGETLSFQGRSWQGQDFTVSGGQILITFVPTPLYRR